MSLLAALLLLAGPLAAQEDSSRINPGLIRPGGLILYYGTDAPLSFVTQGGLPPGAVSTGEVKGKTCQHGVSVPIAASVRATSISAFAGNGGYKKTLALILEKHPEIQGVYDVRIDQQNISILGIYRRICTEVTARGFRQG